MIGNTAVGKTSMLSAISKALDSFNLGGALRLEPTTEEFKILDDQWCKMLEQVESQDAFTPLKAAIKGTAVNFIEHEFDLIVEGSKETKVVFVDTKGMLTNELNDELRNRTNNSFGVFCVIDASVMMECSRATNEKVNCPGRVTHLLQKVYMDGDNRQPLFVSFILTKCESYLLNNETRTNLENTFREKYRDAINMLLGAKVAPNVTCIAVQTMGCVRFHRLNADGLPEFKKTLANASLKTKDCAYPLIILLQNLVRAIDADKWAWGKLMEFFGFKKPLTTYLGELENKAELENDGQTPRLHGEFTKKV